VLGTRFVGVLAFLERVAIPWRALAIAACLSVGLAGALTQILAGASASSPPAAPARAGVNPAPSGLSAAAQSVVSASVGAERRSYWAGRGVGGLRLRNPAQRFSASFDRSGLRVRSGPLELALGLRAIGYGSLLRGLGAAGPESARANRVLDTRGDVSEWALNGPLGLEQGFTIPRAPAQGSVGALTLALALSGNARVALAPGAHGLLLTRAGESLRYGGLTATDARGRVLRSWIELDAGRALLKVDVDGARYPLRIDPLIQQGGKLTAKAGEESSAGGFGISVALSGDGNTALVGAFGDADEAGAAWVFTRSGSTWTQQGKKLTANDETGGTGSEFGTSVALSADGNTALIGGPADNGEEGAAWVFTRSGSTWTQQGKKLTAQAGEEAQGELGWSVALSSDGNTALVGAPADEGEVGAAWVFTRSGSTWTQQGKKLIANDEVGHAGYGFSVALSAEGNTALIGGITDEAEIEGKTTPAGAAWVLTRTGSTWTQQGKKLTANARTPAGQMGSSVALSADGNTALVGERHADGMLGAAWAFTRSGSAWAQQGGKLAAREETGEAQLGWSAALSADGNTALIGGPFDHEDAGAAWEFARSGGLWFQVADKLTANDEVGEGFLGESVALSADGDTAVTGGEGDNGFGAAWAFVNPPIASTAAASSVTATGATLNGNVEVGASSNAYFQYGTSAAYGTATPVQPLGARLSPVGPAEAPPGSPLPAALGGLSPATTYHFRLVAENSAGTSFGADRTFTTASGSGVMLGHPPPGAPALAISAVGESHRSWREGTRAARISRKRPPIGTTFSFTLNEPASVGFVFIQRLSGRSVAGRCVAQTPRNARKHACKRTVTRGAHAYTGHAGADKLSFQGRISRSHTLPTGAYTLLLTAVNAEGEPSNTASLSFTIVK
jgi:FG-GAP repeat